jgi:hypothetical protein
VSADSESRRLESWVMRDSRLERSVLMEASVCISSSLALGDMVEGAENWE